MNPTLRVQFRRTAALLALFSFAAAYYSLGFSIPMQWVDEGHIIYPSWRVANGAVPYRDFGHLYGPSVFWINGGLFRVFGDDLMVPRLFLLLLKSCGAVLVYTLARRVASQTWALSAFMLTLVIWGLPWPVATTPYASYYGITLSLIGVLVVASMSTRVGLACLIAGLCFGLAATFKQTTGAFGAMAVALFLLSEHSTNKSLPVTGLFRFARVARWMVLAVAACTLLFYITSYDSIWSLFLIFAPTGFLIVRLGIAELRAEMDHASQQQSMLHLISLGAGTTIPLLLCASYFASQGLLNQLWFNTVAGVPGHMNWFVPLPSPEVILPWASLWVVAGLAALPSLRESVWAASALVIVGIFSAGTLLARADFNPHWWFWSSHQLIFALPMLASWTALALWHRGDLIDPEADRGDKRSFRLLTFYAATSLLYLHPSGDILHVILCLPVFLPVLARELCRFTAKSQWRSVIAAVGMAAVLVPGIHDLFAERDRRGEDSHSFQRASGIRGAGATSRQGAKLTRVLSQPEYRDGPLFSTSGKQLIYFLAGRESALEEYELGMYLVVTGVINEAGLKAHIDQSAMINRLGELRPLVVEDYHGNAGRRFRSTLPRVAQFIEEAYHPAERIGQFGIRKPLEEGRSTTSKY